MDERRLKAAAVALLSVVVAGVAAATLGQTTGTGAAGVGGGSSGRGGPGGGGGVSELPAPGEPLPLVALIVVVTAILLVIGFVLFPKYTLKQVAWAGVVTAFFVGVLWLLFRAFQPGMPGNQAERAQNMSNPGMGTPGGAGMGGGGTLPELALVGVFVAALLGLGVVGLLLRDTTTPDGAGEAIEDAAALAAIGRSAGRAAERLEAADDATLDNEVYRAWKEMIDHLDVDAAGARTPGEFRETALDAGMAAGDVDALTGLFEEVRYGGARATDDREREATDALRRIEERYATEEASA